MVKKKVDMKKDVGGSSNKNLVRWVIGIVIAGLILWVAISYSSGGSSDDDGLSGGLGTVLREDCDVALYTCLEGCYPDIDVAEDISCEDGCYDASNVCLGTADTEEVAFADEVGFGDYEPTDVACRCEVFGSNSVRTWQVYFDDTCTDITDFFSLPSPCPSNDGEPLPLAIDVADRVIVWDNVGRVCGETFLSPRNEYKNCVAIS